MKEEELIKKLESVDLPRIEVQSHRRRLRAALLQSGYFKEQAKSGVISRTKWKMRSGFGSLMRGLGSRQPIWKAAGVGTLAIVLAVVLSAELLSTAAEDGEERFRIISGLDLSPYTVYQREERTSDPSAQSPEYVFLVASKEAVMLDGPEAKGAEHFFLEDQQIREVDNGYFENYEATGFEVMVNPNLTYTVSIDDFEGEVDLAEVWLGLRGNTITSTFIFAASASGDGVAHDILITAFIDGDEVSSKKAGSIEVRPARGARTQVSLRRISDGAEIGLLPDVLDQVDFTDFAFVIDFNSPVMAGEREDTIAVYRAFWKQWAANTTVKVYAQGGTVNEAMDDFFFPENEPANEVPVVIELIDTETIKVSPVAGSFPPRSQIVLVLVYGEFAPPGMPPAWEGHTERVFTQ